MSRANTSITAFCCSLVSCCQALLVALLSSRMFRVNCMFAPLSGMTVRPLAGCGKSTEQSIHDASRSQQIREGGHAKIRSKCRRRARFCAATVRPFDGKQRTTSVRQDEKIMSTTAPLPLPMNCKGLPFKSVGRTDNRYSRGKVLAMGSVWRFPLITSTMPCS